MAQGNKELVWMETPPATQLGGDLVLEVWTEPGDHP